MARGGIVSRAAGVVALAWVALMAGGLGAEEESAREVAPEAPPEPRAAGLQRPAAIESGPAYEPFDAGRVDLGIRAGDVELAYRVFALFVLPGEALPLDASVPFDLDATTGRAVRSTTGWRWTAPEEVGHHALRIRRASDEATLHVFVMREATQIVRGRLGGYRIGEYAAKPFRNLATYRRPRGFVEVSPDLVDVPVAPHFTLGQFLCKQESDWPKYLVLRPELLIKLERILERLNAEGVYAPRFEVMSGYRTPWYNAQIGNRTRYSRHVYGGAADIFIDAEPRDGVMDDLNGDGVIDKRDADHLYDLFETWSREPWWVPGGIGAYAPNPAHGPFVHVDVRGQRARWGR